MKNRTNFEKFGKDARKLAAEFTPEELAIYLSDQFKIRQLAEVEIAREKPLPFKPSGGGFWWKRQRWPWKWPSMEITS